MTTQPGSRHKHSQGYWRRHIRQLQQSGLSRAEYCRQHHLSYHAMAYWQKKLARPGSVSPALVPVPIRNILQSHGSKEAGIHIILDNRIRIEVREEFSAATLHKVLAVLEAG